MAAQAWTTVDTMKSDVIEDRTISDRTYESFGVQGLAMPTYLEVPYERSSIGLHMRTDRDEHLHDAVLERLTKDGAIDLSDVEIILHDGEVTLSGSVRSETDRTRAELITERVRGVVRVENRLRVLRYYDRGARGSSSTTQSTSMV